MKTALNFSHDTIANGSESLMSTDDRRLGNAEKSEWRLLCFVYSCRWPCRNCGEKNNWLNLHWCFVQNRCTIQTYTCRWSPQTKLYVEYRKTRFFFSLSFYSTTKTIFPSVRMSGVCMICFCVCAKRLRFVTESNVKINYYYYYYCSGSWLRCALFSKFYLSFGIEISNIIA